MRAARPARSTSAGICPRRGDWPRSTPWAPFGVAGAMATPPLPWAPLQPDGLSGHPCQPTGEPASPRTCYLSDLSDPGEVRLNLSLIHISEAHETDSYLVCR